MGPRGAGGWVGGGHHALAVARAAGCMSQGCEGGWPARQGGEGGELGQRGRKGVSWVMGNEKGGRGRGGVGRLGGLLQCE